MNQAIIIMALFVIAAGTGAGLWLIFSTRNRGVSIHVDEKAGIKIKQRMDGLHFDIYYESIEDRPSDSCLFPEIVNDAPGNQETDGRDFWNAVADFDNLPEEKQNAIVQVLRRRGFISEARGREMLSGGDASSSVEFPDISGDYPPRTNAPAHVAVPSSAPKPEARVDSPEGFADFEI